MHSVRARLLSTLAGQLGNPQGVLGKGVAFVLNRSNRAAITGAVAAAGLAPGGAAADVGFGGGAGLPLLLDRVGAGGVVYGVEISADMLARARASHRGDIDAGRLRLLEGSLTALPLPDDSLDAAITVNTVYFVPDLAACAELARVVRPGGRSVIGIGDPGAMAKLPFTSYGFTLRPVPDVIAALEQAGCAVEHRRLAGTPIPHHLLVATPR
ncbi:methyltransferase domain-containing protein [Nocardia beijingensis]|uniref:class I SAM-dependent methyltransferase n=1 Tax=Nocardia beijingensis TaxID=95162 RepID=UPI00189551D0|nr:methyltransferase domain-containing protein [Nocardia beijingensis]MBF6465596.1 methyltransferase domain-containing protein [Nocardia beijingensis]